MAERSTTARNQTDPKKAPDRSRRSAGHAKGATREESALANIERRPPFHALDPREQQSIVKLATGHQAKL